MTSFSTCRRRGAASVTDRMCCACSPHLVRVTARVTARARVRVGDGARVRAGQGHHGYGRAKATVRVGAHLSSEPSSTTMISAGG